MLVEELDKDLYEYICSIKNFTLLKKIKLIFEAKGESELYAHSQMVAQNCTKIAKQYSLSIEKCVMAAYCHDISQIFNPIDVLNYFDRENLYVDTSERKKPFLLHQRCSSIFINENLCIEDSAILDAVECHTTLKANPSEYDLALFIADKLSWGMAEQSSFCDEVIKGLEISLSHAAYAYINYMIRNNKILERHIWLDEAREWLEKNLI